MLPYNDQNWQDFFDFGGRPELAAVASVKDQHSKIDEVEEVCALVAEVTP